MNWLLSDRNVLLFPTWTPHDHQTVRYKSLLAGSFYTAQNWVAIDSILSECVYNISNFWSSLQPTHPDLKQLKKSSKNRSLSGNKSVGIFDNIGKILGATTTALPWQPDSNTLFNLGQKAFWTFTWPQQSCECEIKVIENLLYHRKIAALFIHIFIFIDSL